MARSRNIKPGLFKNEILGEADPIYTILFAGLWCLADKDGRLEDRPKRIRAELFPYRLDIDPCMALAWLNDNLFINRYIVDGEKFIQILKWKKHQSPHHKEVESVIPGVPAEDKTDSNQAVIHTQSKHDSSMPQERPNKVASSPLIPDSLNLIPDSLKQLLPENLKVFMPPDFELNDTNKNFVNDSNLTPTEKHDLVKDFIDYWTLDESKKTDKGWQMAFRRNPIVKRLIVNSKHRGQSNEAHHPARKLSLSERATENRKRAEREIDEQSLGENDPSVRA